jgi:hypothetical protein
MTNRTLFLLSVSVLLVLSVACSKSSASNFEQATSIPTNVALKQGNDRGNGGNSLPRKSSLLQVQSLLLEFQQRAIKEDGCDFYAVGDDWKFAKSVSHRSAIKDASENACPTLQTLFRENRVLIQAAECKDSHTGLPRDGSVSERSTNGTICISTDRLQAIPPGELKVQILGLFLHELMHILGYSEAFAVYVQEYYLRDVLSGDYWGSSYGETPRAIRSYLSRIARPAEVKRYTEEVIQGSNMTRTFFNRIGINCIDEEGSPLNLSSLRDRIQPRLLGLGGFDRDEWAVRLYYKRRSEAHVDGMSKNLPSEYSRDRWDRLNTQEWVETLSSINSMLESTYQQFESVYPMANPLSVCEESAILGRATLRIRIEEERYRRIRELLEFD